MFSGVLEDYFLTKAIVPLLLRLNDTRAVSWRRELFGPVGIVSQFYNYDRLSSIINDTNYGLANGIFCEDIEFAKALGESSLSGTWHINQWGEDGAGIPFGGIKDSGMGKEKCFRTFQQTVFEKSFVEGTV